MSIHAAIYERLSTWAPLTALVGENVFEETLPQDGTFPAVVFNRITSRHIADFQGLGGMAYSLVQIDTLGHEKNALQSIADEVRKALTGANVIGSFAGVNLYSGRALDDVDAPVDFDADLRRVTQQIELCHTESEPV